MSNEMTPHEAMAEAVRLLRDAADELHESHNAPGETTFDGEPEAQAAYEEHERVANALESAIAALSAAPPAPAPVAGDVVPEEPTPEMIYAGARALPRPTVECSSYGQGSWIENRPWERNNEWAVAVWKAMRAALAQDRINNQ